MGSSYYTWNIAIIERNKHYQVQQQEPWNGRSRLWHVPWNGPMQELLENKLYQTI